MTSAREAAVLTLAACETQGAWSDGYLKRAVRGLEKRDAALASRLCFGVLQNRMLLDFYLSRFSKLPPEKLEPKVLCSLRTALYQLLFLDKIPERAAVNEAVELVKRHSRNPRAPGMVNGILRSVLREKGALPPVEGGDAVETLSLRYSHPRWLVEEFAAAAGSEETEALLAADNARPPTTVQVNALRASPEALLDRLRKAGAEGELHPWLPGCLLLTGTGDLEKLETFRQGAFYVQDAASRLAVSASGVRAGDRVLDCCAAPGGKSFAAAIRMRNHGEVVSCDIHPHKIGLIEAGRDRLGLSCVTAREQNARQLVPAWEKSFDAVFADVPCSGLGIIRKKPDIRYKDPEPLKNLPNVQRAILDNACRYVKPGGVLLYSTCTLLRRENEDVVGQFLADHPEFSAEPFTLPPPAGGERRDGMATLWPHRHGTDGFFMAKLRART